MVAEVNLDLAAAFDLLATSESELSANCLQSSPQWPCQAPAPPAAVSAQPPCPKGATVHQGRGQQQQQQQGLSDVVDEHLEFETFGLFEELWHGTGKRTVAGRAAREKQHKGLKLPRRAHWAGGCIIS